MNYVESHGFQAQLKWGIRNLEILTSKGNETIPKGKIVSPRYTHCIAFLFRIKWTPVIEITKL